MTVRIRVAVLTNTALRSKSSLRSEWEAYNILRWSRPRPEWARDIPGKITEMLPAILFPNPLAA